MLATCWGVECQHRILGVHCKQYGRLCAFRTCDCCAGLQCSHIASIFESVVHMVWRDCTSALFLDVWLALVGFGGRGYFRLHTFLNPAMRELCGTHHSVHSTTRSRRASWRCAHNKQHPKRRLWQTCTRLKSSECTSTTGSLRVRRSVCLDHCGVGEWLAACTSLTASRCQQI